MTISNNAIPKKHCMRPWYCLIMNPTIGSCYVETVGQNPAIVLYICIDLPLIKNNLKTTTLFSEVKYSNWKNKIILKPTYK